MTKHLVCDSNGKTIDPLWLKNQLWPGEPYEDFKGHKHPGINFYKQQVEIIYSTENNIETVCVAGNGWPLLLN